jgi:hypothetical protein
MRSLSGLLSSQLEQIAGKCLKEYRLRSVDIKMAAREHSYFYGPMVIPLQAARRSKQVSSSNSAGAMPRASILLARSRLRAIRSEATLRRVVRAAGNRDAPGEPVVRQSVNWAPLKLLRAK